MRARAGLTAVIAMPWLAAFPKTLLNITTRHTGSCSIEPPTDNITRTFLRIWSVHNSASVCNGALRRLAFPYG